MKTYDSFKRVTKTEKKPILKKNYNFWFIKSNRLLLYFFQTQGNVPALSYLQF